MKGRLKRTLKKQDEYDSVKIGVRMEDRSKWSVGINQIFPG